MINMKAYVKGPQIVKFIFNSYKKNIVLAFCEELERNKDRFGYFKPRQVSECRAKDGTLYFTQFIVCMWPVEYDVDSLLQNHLELCDFVGGIAKRLGFEYPNTDCFLQILEPNTGTVETREYQF